MWARSVHLVGSVPAASAEDAMRTAMSSVGPYLRSLPDGETGERRSWIRNIVEGLHEHPDLEEHGEVPTGGQRRRLRVRRGHTLRADTLDLGHVAAFDASFPVFRRIRDESGRDDLAFQVGLPGDFDLSLAVMRPIDALRNRRPFTAAALREIHRIHARAGDGAIFQIEVPLQVVLLAKAPAPARPQLAETLAAGITRLARLSPTGTRFGIHLCVGDPDHKALVHLHDTHPLVLLLNAIVARWPAARPLEFVHVPLAAGAEPAPLDPDFYQPLRRLHLAAHVRFVAGLVHEKRPLDGQRHVLDLVEGHLGRRVDVAAACGLGRRDPESATETLSQAVQLAET